MLARVATGVALGFLAARRIAYRVAEKALLVPRPNGPETPADRGLDCDVFSIPSGTRSLQACLVRPPLGDDAHAAVLIFHGTHESNSQWVPVQQILGEHGMASMVFDYSGFGDSTGSPTVANLRQDVQAAYSAFTARTHPESRRYLLGYSLGTGFLLEGAPSFGDSFNGVVLVAGYSSAREASVARGVLPSMLAFLVPDVYDNVRMVKRLDRPLLVVHSEDDERLPFQMAERVFAAGNEPKRLFALRGLRHAGMVDGQAAEYLAPVFEFIEGARDRAGVRIRV